MFKPRSPTSGLVLFALCYVGGAGAATVMAYLDLGFGSASIVSIASKRALLVILYLAMGYFVLLYGVFGAYRFRFYEQSFRVFTWRGWRSFHWSLVKRAQIGNLRGNVELAMFFGPRSFVSLPLSQFQRGGSLLAFIRSRVSVPIPASDHHLKLIADR